MIYEAVVDAAKSGANVVITDDQECADKTMDALPNEDGNPEIIKDNVVPPLRIVVGNKRVLGRSPGRPKKKRRKMTPRKIVLGSGANSNNRNSADTSVHSNNNSTGDGCVPVNEEDSNGVFESEIPNPDNLTEAVSAVVRQEKLSVFGEYLEGNEEIGAEGFKPQATSSQSSYPGQEEEGEGEDGTFAPMEGPEGERGEDEPVTAKNDEGTTDEVEEEDIISKQQPSALAAHDESGMEMCDSSMETRSPSGCTPDTDATDGNNHDSDSGIGRDAGLSEQESMDKSHSSDTTPSLFENPLSDAQSSDTQTPESETRELIMEDMSCQTGDDLMENEQEETEEHAVANEEAEENHVPEGPANQEAEESNTTLPEENHVADDEPIIVELPDSEAQPPCEVTNEVCGGENPDVCETRDVEMLSDPEVDVQNNNNEVVEGHDDSEATEEGNGF